MADIADEESRRSSSGGRLSGCESRSYLDERLEEYEAERRSRSLTRACDFLSGDLLSGDEGGVPGLLLCTGAPGASLGGSGCFDFLDDLWKREGRTMRGEKRVDGTLGVTRFYHGRQSKKVWLSSGSDVKKRAHGGRGPSSTFYRPVR